MGNLWRLWRIMFVFTRYRLDALVPLEQLPLKLRILLWLAPWRLNPVGKLSRGARDYPRWFLTDPDPVDDFCRWLHRLLRYCLAVPDGRDALPGDRRRDAGGQRPD